MSSRRLENFSQHMTSKKISIISACFNEEENIAEMYKRVVAVFKGIKKKYDFELIYVDNNSTDKSQKVYESLVKKDPRVSVIFMSRNFGSPQPSFIAGLEHATGAASVLFHGDIQDPPEMIPQFIEKWEKGYDVVYGVRKDRKGYGFMMKFFYKFFYYLLNKLAYIQIPLNAGEFSLMDKVVVKELINIPESDYYLRCLRAFVGFRQTGIPYIRDARTHGRSTESFISGLWWAKTIIVNFSFKPLTWISQLAFLIVIASFLSIIVFLVSYYFNPSSPRGIPTLFILILFLGGVQLLSISVIAEYISKIFLEVKRRPRYIVRKILKQK